MREAVNRRALAPLVALQLLCPAISHAHTGFPETRQILLPPDRPEHITLATNFGLLLSDDDGASFRYSCEQSETAYANQYGLGAPPAGKLFALSGNGVARSDDRSCTWSTSAPHDVLPYGFALDPTDAERVYVFGAPRTAVASGDSLYLSRDGGVTLGEPSFTAPAGDMILTVLPAPDTAGKLFMALLSAERGPLLLSSSDYAETWDERSILSDSLGPYPFELLAVQGERLFVRVLEAAAETLAISEDGGRSFARSVSVPGKLAAVLPLASGTILVGGTVGTDPIGYRSEDGARSFSSWPQAPRVHALAERNGKLYVAADNFLDGFAVAVSSDEGLHLTPLVSFGQVQSVDDCVGERCAEACAYYADLGLWPQGVCDTRAEPPNGAEPEGGSGGSADAGGEGPAPAGAGEAGTAGGAPGRNPDPGVVTDERSATLRSRGGCGCVVRERGGGNAADVAFLALWLAVARRRARVRWASAQRT